MPAGVGGMSVLPADMLSGKRARHPTRINPPIATIAGRPVPRERVVDLLLRAHGPGLLEQLIVLDAATGMAAEKGLTVNQADVDKEYDLALRRLVDPLWEMTPTPFDREAAEPLLDSVLSQRNISREEFLLGMRRNAYLRRIVESEQVLTEEQLRAEYERCYGARVRIRHIQLATAGAAARVQERLTAGEAFEGLARTFSVNLASGVSGGLLDPFAETDHRVPAALREAAFSLRPGEAFKTVQIGKWFHIIKVEEVLPAEEQEFSAVRGELERSLGERLSEPAIRELYERLFRQTPVEIHDTILRDAFERKHPERAR